MHRIRNQKGLTLTELMIAVSIAVLLAGAGMVTFSGQLPSLQLKAAARDYVADVWRARQRAVNENRQYAVQFLSPTSYRIVRGDQEILRQSGTLVPILTRDFREGQAGRSHVQYLVPETAPVFRPDGMISRWDGGLGGFDAGAPDELLFTSTENRTKTVSISRLGRIKIQ